MRSTLTTPETEAENTRISSETTNKERQADADQPQKIVRRKLAASDGHVGHVEDFYFEDQRWAIRYVVANTGCWMPGRLVLLSPYAFGRLEHCGDCLPRNLTQQQESRLVFAGDISENSPPMRTRICEGLGFLGLYLDDRSNTGNSPRISRADSRAAVRVIPTDEEILLAQAALAFVPSAGDHAGD